MGLFDIAPSEWRGNVESTFEYGIKFVLEGKVEPFGARSGERKRTDAGVDDTSGGRTNAWNAGVLMTLECIVLGSDGLQAFKA